MIKRIRFLLNKKVTVSNILDVAAKYWKQDHEILSYEKKPLFITDNQLDIQGLTRVVNQLCHYLTSIGIKKGDKIAIYKKNSVDYLILSLSFFRIGAITVPIHGELDKDIAAAYMKKIANKYVILDTENNLKISDQESLNKIIIQDDGGFLYNDSVQSINTLSTNFSAVTIDKHNDAMICHTSGTTGAPKGVLHHSDSIILGVKGQIKSQPITRKNKVIIGTKGNHNITQVTLVTSLASGLPMFFSETDDANTFVEQIERENCSISLCFPYMYQKISDLNLGRNRLKSMKLWLATGDTSHEKHIRNLVGFGSYIKLFGILPSMYIEMFGTSEIAYAALVKISTKYRKNYARDIGNSNMSIADAKLIDENGLEIKKDLVPGKIVVKSPTMFKRYENDEKKTKEAFFDGWFWPGDVCYKKNGNFIHLDRFIDTLTYNKKKYYSLLIEEVIFQAPGVMEVSVFNYQSDIVAVIETDTTYSEAVMQEILNKNDLGFIKVKIAVGNVIPRGVTNKILKRELRETGGLA